MAIEGMKTFLKRAGITFGVLVFAAICLGFVYIDTLNNYWQYSGGFIRLVVNTNAQAAITIATNPALQAVGFNTNNTARSFVVAGRKPATNTTGNGTTAATTGSIVLVGGTGGESTLPTTAIGGTGGALVFQGGAGGGSSGAVTNSTGGTGGSVTFTGGAGNAGQTAAGPATNSVGGGSGGSFTFNAGNGGNPGAPATNTVGGNGGNMTLFSGNGGTPSAGWSRVGGSAGNFSFNGGTGGNGTRTNSGSGGGVEFYGGNSGNTSSGGDVGLPGAVTLAAGSSGNASGGGNPNAGADVNVYAGAGGTGASNSFGGGVYVYGGAGGGSARAGDVVLARSGPTSPQLGGSYGGVMIGPALAGAAAITNLLGASASLDFGSTATLASSDLPITVTGVVSNNCAVALSVPWESASGGGAFTTFCSNDTIYVRFSNNTALSIDPTPGTFTVVAFRIR